MVSLLQLELGVFYFLLTFDDATTYLLRFIAVWCALNFASKFRVPHVDTASPRRLGITTKNTLYAEH